MSDITQVKEREKEKQSIRFQKMYFHSMAHDVRTPLVSIVCSNENLKQLLKDPEQQKMVELSESATYVLLVMFDQISELSKLEFNLLTVEQLLL